MPQVILNLLYFTRCVLVYRERQERKAWEEKSKKEKREKKEAEKKKKDEERKKADLEKEQAKEEKVGWSLQTVVLQMYLW